MIVLFDMEFLITFLSFNIFNMPSHCLLAMGSDMKLAVDLTENNLDLMNLFSLADFKILFLSSSFNSLIIICLDVDLIEFIPLGSCYASLMCRSMYFIKFGKFLVIILPNIFPPSSNAPLPLELQQYIC